MVFFVAVVCGSVVAGLCSEHFTIDGTLTDSFAAAMSIQPMEPGDASPVVANAFQPRSLDVDFRGQKRTNDTHRSRTEPEARM